MDPTQIANQSEENLGQSATSYHAVDVSAAAYVPARPFKGVFVGGDGNLVITGVDSVTVTLAVSAGCWPFGGIAITMATTATGVVALF